MSLTKSKIAIILLALMLFLTACGGEDNPDENEQTEMPGEITEMESKLLNIMQQADLVPVVLFEQARSNETEEQESEKAEQNEEEQNGANEEGAAAEGELTFDETILSEVLEKEADQESIDEKEELPQSLEIIWDDIKNSITELYELWDDLETLLVERNVTQNAIDYFETGLDNLTVFSMEQDYFATMDAANQLTRHLSEFMVPFAENILSLTYELKFHIRNIVVQAASEDYAGAKESLDYIKDQRAILAKEIDETQFRELGSSLNNLQRVIDKQNLDLIILNAAVVMENMVEVIDRTA